MMPTSGDYRLPAATLVRPRKPWLTDRSGLVPVYHAKAVSVAVGPFEQCRNGAAEGPHLGGEIRGRGKCYGVLLYDSSS